MISRMSVIVCNTPWYMHNEWFVFKGVNAELAYHLIDSLGLLWIDPDTGVISVLDSDGLDREKHEQFTVQVI